MSQVDKRPLECLIKSIRTNCELAATVGENDCVYGNERGKEGKVDVLYTQSVDFIGPEIQQAPIRIHESYTYFVNVSHS